MSKNLTSKRGLVVGAIVSLVASMFGTTPASAAPSTDAFFFAPAAGTSFTTLVDEDFSLVTARNPVVVSAAEMNASGAFKYSITTNRTYNTTFSIEVYAGAAASSTPVAASGSALAEYANQHIYYQGYQIGAADSIQNTISGLVGAVPATESYVISPATVSASLTNMLSAVFHGGLISSSPTLTMDVTAFIDTNGNNKFDSNLEVSATQRITFLTYGGVTTAVTGNALYSGDTATTMVASISGVNIEQLDGTWYLKANQYSAAGRYAALSYSPTSGAIGFQPASVDTTVVFSRSYTLSTSHAPHTVSGQIGYAKAGSTYTASAEGELYLWAAAGSVTIAADAASAITAAVVTNENAKYTGNTRVYDVRPNSVYTIRVTASSIVSSSPLPSVTFTFSSALSATKQMSVNGGTAQITGTHSAVSVPFNSSGVASITVSVAGYSVGDFISVSANVNGVASQEVNMGVVALDWTVTADAAQVASTKGTATAIGVSVKDQFLVKSALTTQRIKFTWGSGYNGSATTSYVALSGGEADASVTFASPTLNTGSYTITAQLQDFTAATNLWADSSGDSADITMTVYQSGTANAFRNGLAASYSASISYGAAFSWSAAVGAPYVLITGSQVVVSGTGLIFKDAAGDTASDTITLPGTSTGLAEFYVTARKAGTYTVTLTAGTATTTSEIVVLAARSDDGAAIEWDTTSITPGKTKIVTGTVVDANGNPVDTTAMGAAGDGSTASILVTYAGTAGIPVGSMPTETDADGKFRVSILTSTADSGTFTLTATYLPQGASTATADKVTSVQSITVGASEASADQKITVGTFKGYIAIYTKGYMGQKLSAKVAGKWMVQDPIVAWNGNDYSRAVRLTGAGYTIKVDLYIDGVFVRSETLTTK